MGLSIGGLGTGLDTAGIVAQLMATERIPQNKIAALGQKAQQQVSTWNDLRTKVQSLQTAAEALRTPAKALSPTATSSNATALRVTAGADALPGLTSVEVLALATAERRTAALGPPGMTVGAGTSVLVSGRLGSGTAEPTSTLDFSGAKEGAHTVQVTRGSSAPTAYGSVQLNATAKDLRVTLADGSTTDVVLGSYASADAMVADLNEQLDGVASVRVTGGRLEVRGLTQGSASSLAFSGGAASALGLPSETLKGSAARVVVDGQYLDVEPEPDGSTREQELGDTGITMTVGASVDRGTVRGNVVTTEEGDTLRDLQAKLNASGSPVVATLVASPDGAGSTLVMTSTTTGAEGGVQVTSGHAALSALGPATAGTDARIKVGGQEISRGSNTITDALPGVTLDLLYAPTRTKPGTTTGETIPDPVNVTVARDSSGTKDKVKALVDAMNAVISTVTKATKYDVASGQGGPLVGNSVARGLSASLFSMAGRAPASGELRTLAQLGIQSTREGTFEFTASKLAEVVDTNPEDLARLVSGFSDKVATWAKDTAKTGGALTGQRDGADAEVTARKRQYDAMDTRLERTEARYKKQFAALETAMAQLNSQRTAMSAALGGMTAS